MKVNKIVIGYVTQTFDTEKKEWLNQEFVAGDETYFETDSGEKAESFDEYLPFDMVQPEAV